MRPTPEELQKAYHVIERERFWSKVNLHGPMHPVLKTCCWLWKGAHQDSGHGVFRLREQRMPAGKAALILSGIEVEDGMDMCHHCDNPPCVRPDHIFQGTDADNHRDMYLKRRHAHGERSGTVVLTERKVRHIVDEYKKGARACDLAKKHKVTTGTISNIVKGVTWAHITEGASITRGRARGNRSPSAKLTEELVLHLRPQWKAGKLNISQTARDLGVERATLRLALNGTNWAHIK